MYYHFLTLFSRRHPGRYVRRQRAEGVHRQHKTGVSSESSSSDDDDEDDEDDGKGDTARMAIRELVEEKMEGKLKMVTVTTQTQTARSKQAKEAQTP